MDGELVVEGAWPLSIEQEARIKGIIKCADINIFGTFDGTIHATGRVTIHSSAIISGRIYANGLIVHPGSVLNIEGSIDGAAL